MMTRKSTAFTLIEILVVLGILAFLMYFFGGKIKNLLMGSKVKTTDIKLANVEQAVMRYSQDVHKYPPNLQALYEQPRDVDPRKWIGPYLTEDDDIVDAWQNEFEYNAPPKRYKDNPYKKYEIISYGADGEEGGTGENAERHKGL